MKHCSKCGKEKPLSEFYPDRSRPAGYDAQCKECRRARRRERWAENVGAEQDKQAARRQTPEHTQLRFAWRLARDFRMTVEQYEALLEAQEHACALCGLPEDKVHHTTGDAQRLAVDHDHLCCPTTPTCGTCTRGLLCAWCNTLLGKIEARPGVAHRIVAYLARRP